MSGDRWQGEGEDDWFDEDDQPAEPQPLASGQRRKRALLTSGALVGLAAAGDVASVLLSGGPSTGPVAAAATQSSQAVTGFDPSATDPALAAQQTAQAFLSAWQNGNDAAAAALTDSPGPAQAALDSYHSDLGISALTLQAQPGDASGNVPFNISATVGLNVPASSGVGATTVRGTWTYTSQLTAYSTDGRWLVQWEPDVLAPNLSTDTHLKLTPVAPGAGGVTDAKGNSLAGESDPGLQRIAQILAARAPSGQGTPGIDVAIADSTGTPVQGIAPAVVTQPVASGNLATTIDPTAESAAVAAVQQHQASSMVVLQPSTGDILAIANNDQDNDDALTAAVAPGSTMKVVTSAALLDHGLSDTSDVPCPEYYTVTGVTTSNSGNESRPDGTELIDDFAASCNNAFTAQYLKLSGGVLAQTAQGYFGLNQPWDIGLGDPSTYFTMPGDAVNSELAAESFGQGTLEASPLAMASVAATVDTGSFHQPILVPGTKQVSASALPSDTASQLRKMMRAVVTYSDGTAHGVGFGSDVYAKTGTADDQPHTQPNSWIIVYDPALNVAIACVVLNAGDGAQYAGPEVKSVLAAL